MIDTLNIGKYIYNTLKDIEGVGVYPLVADNDAKFPFLVYKRMNLTSNGCKDGYYEDKATVEITVVTDTYYKGIDIARQVRDLLEKQTVYYNGMKLNNSYLSFATEEYINNAFIQRMQFNMTIN